jgi:hypothetical protein
MQDVKNGTGGHEEGVEGTKRGCDEFESTALAQGGQQELLGVERCQTRAVELGR